MEKDILLNSIQEETKVKELIKELSETKEELNKCKSLLCNIQTIYQINIDKCSYCDRYEVGDDMFYIKYCYICNKECCSNHYKNVNDIICCIKCIDKK